MPTELADGEQSQHVGSEGPELSMKAIGAPLLAPYSYWVLTEHLMSFPSAGKYPERLIAAESHPVRDGDTACFHSLISCLSTLCPAGMKRSAMWKAR